MEQAGGDLLLRAYIRNILWRVTTMRLAKKSLADIKDVLQQHGRSVDGCQQLVGAEAAAYAGRQDDAGYFKNILRS